MLANIGRQMPAWVLLTVKHADDKDRAVLLYSVNDAVRSHRVKSNAVAMPLPKARGAGMIRDPAKTGSKRIVVPDRRGGTKLRNTVAQYGVEIAICATR